MGKVLFAVCALLVVCIAGLGLLSYLVQEDDTLAVDNLLAEDLTRLIQRGGEVDLATETDFAWDRVLIVAPRTPKAEIDKALGHEFDGTLNYDAESNGLFVFERAHEVVRFADYRGRGVFRGFRTPVDPLSYDRARLRVRRLVISPG